MPQHFEEHHDIGFYASELCITTTYLSRVVRQVSGGRTVVDYINQMLLMEATFLLRQTSMSITQISDQLHFAEVTTFARFFNRMKGMNPREFRKGK
ncbi:MAG: AraC family transcriptional regulator [Prevotella sp.]|nr:AraC family transcriptional regulator [Prevotella sp.]